MLGQTFALEDLATIAALTFLEILLSADNAIALGALSHKLLPPAQRKRVLFIGLGFSFVFRGVALLFIAYLLKWRWIQAIAAVSLIYLAVQHFRQKKKDRDLPQFSGFWKSLFMIESLDLVFAIDSIFAGVAFIDANYAKLWIVCLGAFTGMVCIRHAAHWFSKLMERFPRLDTSAYLMVGWIGCKLAAELTAWPLPGPIFWILILILFGLGFYPVSKK